jgi:hypothetical protein
LTEGSAEIFGCAYSYTCKIRFSRLCHFIP